MAQVLPVIGVIASLAGTVMQAQDAQQQAAYQAKIAQMNANINIQNAQRAREAAAVEAQEQDFLSKALIAEEISKQAASGITLGSRSYALQRKGLHELAKKDALRVINEGEVDAYNFLTQAAGYKMEASAAKAAGKNALATGLISGVGTLVGSSPFQSLVGQATTTRKVLNKPQTGIKPR